MPCFDCVGPDEISFDAVGLGEISGNEAPVYRYPLNGVCGSGPLFPDFTTCDTLVCGFDPQENTIWYNCDGSCPAFGNQPSQCSLEFAGYLIGPDAQFYE